MSMLSREARQAIKDRIDLHSDNAARYRICNDDLSDDKATELEAIAMSLSLELKRLNGD